MIEQKNTIMHYKTFEGKLLQIRDILVLIDKDVAELFGIETRDVNKAVKNNPAKFPNGYIMQLNKSEKKELVKNFHRFNSLKHSSTTPKAFTEKGLYMLATILKSKVATEATIQIIETFAKVKELSRNINGIVKTTDETLQKELAQKSNKILEEIIDIEPEILEDDEDGEIIETTTKFAPQGYFYGQFNLGFAKVSRSVKRVKR